MMLNILFAALAGVFFTPQVVDMEQVIPTGTHKTTAPDLVKLERIYTLNEMDDFAARILDDLQKPSFAHNVEYCGMLVTRDGRTLAATPARRGRAASCVIARPDPDSGLTMVASYHTHAGDDVRADGEVPSATDLLSDMADGIPGYVATPGGRLWKTDPERQVVRLICASGCVRRDPRFIDCPDRAAGTHHTLWELEARANSIDGTCPVPQAHRHSR